MVMWIPIVRESLQFSISFHVKDDKMTTRDTQKHVSFYPPIDQQKCLKKRSQVIVNTKTTSIYLVCKNTHQGKLKV